MSWYVCNTLLGCRPVDSIYIYCSDKSIMDYVPDDPRLIFLQRDTRLDGDNITAQDTYSAFVNDVEADVYVAGLTTAPFIKASSIEKGIKAVQSGEYDSAFAAKRLQTFAWYKGNPLNYDPASIPRTQDLEPVFAETSGFFVFTRELWEKHRRRIGFRPYMVEVNDIEAVDIDTREDFDLARMIAGGLSHEG